MVLALCTCTDDVLHTIRRQKAKTSFNWRKLCHHFSKSAILFFNGETGHLEKLLKHIGHFGEFAEETKSLQHFCTRVQTWFLAAVPPRQSCCLWGWFWHGMSVKICHAPFCLQNQNNLFQSLIKNLSIRWLCMHSWSVSPYTVSVLI